MKVFSFCILDEFFIKFVLYLIDMIWYCDQFGYSAGKEIIKS